MAEECGEISICETDATISANQTEIRVRFFLIWEREREIELRWNGSASESMDSDMRSYKTSLKIKKKLKPK